MSLKTRIASLAQNPSLRSIATLVQGTGAGVALTILATPIISRIYSPEELGVYGVFQSAFLMLLGAAAFRFEQAIPLQSSDEEAADILRLSVVSSFIFAAALFAIMALAGSWIGDVVNAPLLGEHPWLLPLALAIGGLYQAGSSWRVRMKDFPVIARTTFAQALVMTIAQLTLPFILGKTGLVCSGGLAAGRLAGVTQVLAGAPWRPKGGLRQGLIRAWGTAKEQRRFALYAAPASVANAAGLMLPAILLSWGYGAAASVLLTLSVRFLGAPGVLLGQAVAQVYTSDFSRLLQEKPQDLPALFRQTLKRLAIPSAAMAVVGFSAPLWFGPVFGAAYAEGGLWAAILTPSYCMGLLCSPVSTTAALTGRQDLQLKLDLFRLALVCASIVIPIVLGWAPLAAVGVFGAAMFGSYLAYLAAHYRCAQVAATAS